MIDFCQLKDSVSELNAESNELFLAMLPQRVEMLPGLEDLLNWLERNRIPKAVATSSSRRLAEAALGHFDLIPRFQFVLTGDDVTRGKPDPEIYFSAAGKLRVETARMLVLEDSVNGTRAALSAGAVTVAVPGNHQDEGEFSHVKHIARALNAPVVWQLLEAGNVDAAG
jgi:pseudouridine 5'-phosphatase